MNICFYAPFKPLGHPNPSGDLIIATGLFEYFKKRGHSIWPASTLRSRWIYWKPWRWVKFLKEFRQAQRRIGWRRPDLWFTYHTYYKAPDLIGPYAARSRMIPYVIFQGIYSTKRKRDWRTWPGYILNKGTLSAAQHVFTNRREDFVNLKRIIPSQRVTYVAPGIYPETFYFEPVPRAELRRTWDVGDDPVIIKDIMAQQLISPVKWYEIIVKMLDMEIDTFVEVGPKKVLTGLLKKIIPLESASKVYNVEDMNSLNNFLEAVN